MQSEPMLVSSIFEEWLPETFGADSVPMNFDLGAMHKSFAKGWKERSRCLTPAGMTALHPLPDSREADYKARAEAALRDRDLIAEAVREECAKVCGDHADFLHKEAHSGGDFEHLITRLKEARCLESKIRSLSLASAREELERLRADAERYRLRRYGAYLGHTVEQRAVGNTPADEQCFNNSYDRASDGLSALAARKSKP